MAAKTNRNMQRIMKLRASKSDYEAFASAAQATGLTISAWMRATMLERAAELRARKVIP